jgi:polyhydroxyalkanoate synthesis repressor PhaR
VQGAQIIGEIELLIGLECSVSNDQGEQVNHAKAEGAKAANTIVIKKYANRRLYNTATSTYVTLDDLAQMVRGGTIFVVYDAKTGEDITRSVLTQIIFEEENKGGAQNLLPINFLRQLIRFYGDAMQGVVPSYLEMSLDSLTKDQDKIRKQMTDAMAGGLAGGIPGMTGAPFGADSMKAIEEITRTNMQMFQNAMKTFNPFAAAMGTGSTGPGSAKGSGDGLAGAKPDESPGSSRDDLQQLKEQMAAMQAMLNQMNVK